MIRSVTPGDLWRLRRKPHNAVLFHTDDLLVQEHQPFWFASRCFFAGNGRDRTTFTQAERERYAFIQVKGRDGRPEQDVVLLATHGTRAHASGSSDYDVWYRLLEHAIYHAGHAHVQRLYAALWSHQNDEREIFRQVGFQPYLRRFVLQLAGPDWDQGTRIAAMRVQSRRDAWAIHRLYGSIAPHLVQSSEVRTARSWMLPLTHGWNRLRLRGWVQGSDDDLRVYVHVRSGPMAHLLSVLIHPSVRDSLSDVLRFGLSQIDDARPVYLVLAEYQSELLMPAQHFGFQPLGEQSLLLKQTAVPARRLILLPTFETEVGLEPRVTVSGNSVREETPTYVRTTQHDQ